MSVKREASESFGVTKERALASIRMILEKGQKTYRYVEIAVDEGTGEVHARIKPILWPLFLSTRLDIQVQDEGKGSRVTAITRSQWFILGDVFDFYRKYLQDIMICLKSQLGMEADPSSGMEESSSNDRLFGTVSLFLLIVALLVPWIIAAFPGGEEKAVAFGVVAGVLSLIFAVIGRRHKTGRVTMYATGILFCLAVVMGILFAMVRKSEMQAEVEKMKALKQAHMTEMEVMARAQRQEMENRHEQADRSREPPR